MEQIKNLGELSTGDKARYVQTLLAGMTSSYQLVSEDGPSPLVCGQIRVNPPLTVYELQLGNDTPIRLDRDNRIERENEVPMICLTEPGKLVERHKTLRVDVYYQHYPVQRSDNDPNDYDLVIALVRIGYWNHGQVQKQMVFKVFSGPEKAKCRRNYWSSPPLLASVSSTVSAMPLRYGEVVNGIEKFIVAATVPSLARCRTIGDILYKLKVHRLHPGDLELFTPALLEELQVLLAYHREQSDSRGAGDKIFDVIIKDLEEYMEDEAAPQLLSLLKAKKQRIIALSERSS